MSVVYFLTAREVNRVKIGVTRQCLSARLLAFRHGSPCVLRFEATIPGDRKTEQRLHKQFATARVHGEWFTITPEIEALIAANPVKGQRPFPPRITYANGVRSTEYVEI